MYGAMSELLVAYEKVIELTRIQTEIIDRLYQALSQVADIGDEDLEAICAAAKLRESVQEKGYI